jgi:glycosyltransferase involved in cell wall biosynthesis
MVMKVVFDCTALSNWTGHATGIQRVVAEIGTELIPCFATAQLGTFSAHGRCFSYSIANRKSGEEIRLQKGDLVISAGANWDFPDHHKVLLSLGQQGIRLGFMFYDTIPILLPFSYGPGFSSIYEIWLNESIGAANIAFAISQNTRRDVIAYAERAGLRVPPVHVVRLGDNIPTAGEIPSATIAVKAMSSFILSVGTLEYRKNHIILLNAYRYLIDEMDYQPPKLYLVGKKGWLDGDIEYQVANDVRLKGLIEILQGLSDSDLQCLYRSALFTVYPSFYEGWGLPVAESLCFGKPCIASRSSSMLEIAPELTRFAHPMLVHEWAQQIRELADNPELLAKETASVRSGYNPTSWAEAAAQLRAALLTNYPELAA